MFLEYGKKRLVGMLLVLVFAPSAPAATESQAVAQDQRSLLEANLQRTQSFMEDVRAQIDRAAFDFDALLDSLNYESEEIIAFSKSAISFEQYPGVLRGPLGTLFSRAGNSADQALLLAKLLRDAGYDARIASAQLDGEGAEAVLRAMKQPVKSAPAFGDARGILDTLEQYQILRNELTAEQGAAYANFVGTPPSAQSSGEFESMMKSAEELQQALEGAGIVLTNRKVPANLLEEVKQYFWVQFKDSTSDPWIDAHPVFHEEAPFVGLEAQSYISGEVPHELQYRLRFQVFIERKTGDKLEVVPVTSPWERPIANLVGVPLTFSNIADSMLSVESLNSDLETLLREAGTFVPGFGNSMAPGARFFDLNGTLIDPMAAQDSAAGLFATINDAFEGSLGQLGGESAIPTLTAQWMEFTIIEPGGAETQYRRTTFDRIGIAARQAGEPPTDLKPTTNEDARELLRRHTFMIAVGAIPRGYVVESAFHHFLKSRPGIQAVLDLEFDRPVNSSTISDVPAGWAGHLALFTAFDAARTIGPAHRNYRSGPALVVHSEGLGESSSWVETVDIVTNPRRAINLDFDVPTIDPTFVLRAGVWETGIEGFMLDGQVVLNTSTVFELATREGIGVETLLPGQPPSNIEYPPDALTAVRNELDRGYAVVIPSRAPSSGQVAWWRIDPRTGETLGQIADGRGGEMVETLVTMVVSFAAFTYGAVQCQGISNPTARTCCHSANAGMALMSVGIGLGLAGAAGAIASVTLDVNRSVIPTGPVCEALFSHSGELPSGVPAGLVAFSCMTLPRFQPNAIQATVPSGRNSHAGS